MPKHPYGGKLSTCDQIYRYMGGNDTKHVIVQTPSRTTTKNGADDSNHVLKATDENEAKTCEFKISSEKDWNISQPTSGNPLLPQ